MSERVVVDPITRIEGHLRIEAEMDLSLIHISEPTRQLASSRMPSSA